MASLPSDMEMTEDDSVNERTLVATKRRGGWHIERQESDVTLQAFRAALKNGQLKKFGSMYGGTRFGYTITNEDDPNDDLFGEITIDESDIPRWESFAREVRNFVHK